MELLKKEVNTMKMDDEMKKINLKIKKVEKKYKKTIQMMNNSYDAVNDVLVDIPYSKEELSLEFDCYVQNVLLKVALSDHELSLNELEMVRKIVIHQPNEILTMLGLEISEKSLQEAENKLNEKLKEIPKFIKIFASADLKMNQLRRHPKNYSKKIFNSLLSLITSMMQADGIIYTTEVLKSHVVLEPIVSFYEEEGLC